MAGSGRPGAAVCVARASTTGGVPRSPGAQVQSVQCSRPDRSRAMRACVWATTAAALLTLTAAAARRSDQDFEFDDDAETPTATSIGHARRPRRYIYDPHNPLCRSLVCKKREVCVLRDASTALCATKKDIIHSGDALVAAGAAEWGARDDDVFYEGGDADADVDDVRLDRCVGCPARSRGQFLCGSDNRTYSSLCRLDLHNCVRRRARPVRLACRGFCPCAHQPRRDREGRRRAGATRNEVLPDADAPRRRYPQGSDGCALDKMADRLLDWFSVLMEEAGAGPPPPAGFPSECKPEVRWMFAHLDTDGDGLLSAANLYSLRHDDRERCLRPFLSSCGGGGGGGVSRAAWCGCLRRAARPCTALARAHPNTHPGAYVPACDAAGFYRPRQCHAALGVCWCVDAHGVERPGSRTKGAPACPPHTPRQLARAHAQDEKSSGDGEGAPDDDEDAPGSGDHELSF